MPYIKPEQAFSAFAGKAFSFFFDQNDQQSTLNHFSILVFDPVETLVTYENQTLWRKGVLQKEIFENPFNLLASRLAAWEITLDHNLKTNFPFTGGAAGFFGYGLAHHLEQLPSTPKDDLGCPDMAIGIYDQALVFNLNQKSCSYCVYAPTLIKAQEKADQVLKLLNNIDLSTNKVMQESSPDWLPDKPRPEFESNISRVIEYIHAGDIFQANLALRITAKVPDYYNAYHHYCSLRLTNPAPYSAYLNFEDFQILSSSPELFLSCKSKNVLTKPIKGTLSNIYPAQQLLESEKDRAENIMIVDLMRNDLSKVCLDDTIEVPELCIIETYRGLHHMVSTITGTLREDMNSIDLLKACFPGGSVTGAPKIRAMEIIDQLESYKRGPYCGSIGFINFDGDMTTSIAIRTLIHKNNQLYLNAGSGIVADSIPTIEYDEMMLKASKLQESLT